MDTKNAPMLDVRTSQAIKGLAIALMLVHHLYTFPEWIPEIPISTTFAMIFREPTRICVSLFAFLTGWAFAHHKNRSVREALKKDLRFLLNYWPACILCFAISALVLDQPPNPKSLLLEMIGLSSTIMIFCWYVAFFIAAMPLLAALSRLLDRNLWLGMLVGWFGVFAACLALFHVIHNAQLRQILYYLAEYFPIVCSGYLCARFDLFTSLRAALSRIRLNHAPVYVLVFLLMMSARTLFPHFLQFTMDAIYAPLAVFALSELFSSPHLASPAAILRFLGRHSANIWFLHGVFFIGGLPKMHWIAYWPRVPVLVFLWVLAVCLIVSMGLERIQRLLTRIPILQKKT